MFNPFWSIVEFISKELPAVTGPMSISTQRAVLRRVFLRACRITTAFEIRNLDIFWKINLDCKSLKFHSLFLCYWCSAVALCKEKVAERSIERRIMFTWLKRSASHFDGQKKITLLGRTNAVCFFFLCCIGSSLGGTRSVLFNVPLCISETNDESGNMQIKIIVLNYETTIINYRLIYIENKKGFT
jgi:hypothetical protein